MKPKNTICPGSKDAVEAANSMPRRFPTARSRPFMAPADYPSGGRGVLTVEFTVLAFLSGLNGGTMFATRGAFSFQVATDDQEEPTATERDRGNGGQESACGCARPLASRQITPRALTEAPQPAARAQRAWSDDGDGQDRRRCHREGATGVEGRG